MAFEAQKRVPVFSHDLICPQQLRENVRSVGTCCRSLACSRGELVVVLYRRFDAELAGQRTRHARNSTAETRF